MEHYSSFCTFEIATFANVLGHYLRKYGNSGNNLVFIPIHILIGKIQPQKDVRPIVTLERNKRKTAAPSAIQFTTKLKSQESDFCSE